jgi:hypothetical protein
MHTLPFHAPIVRSISSEHLRIPSLRLYSQSIVCGEYPIAGAMSGPVLRLCI